MKKKKKKKKKKKNRRKESSICGTPEKIVKPAACDFLNYNSAVVFWEKK